MSESTVPLSTPAVLALAEPGQTHSKRIKIGEVARHFNISVDLLRLYEREGLLIPLKSSKGTRYFTESDYPWIGTLLHLVRAEGLNFAGIRRLLALIPCWSLQGCDDTHKAQCHQLLSAVQPCWTDHSCCTPEGNCYACEVYRTASQCENLKALVSIKPA
ncbi:MAG: MerR family transcriptional regulator [Acidobacteriota bacterium]|nr:MerR family transcriptional regulator [Acidobacteriota bacterium]